LHALLLGGDTLAMAATDVAAHGPLVFDDDRGIDQLRELLDAADFTVERVESALQTHELSVRTVDTLVHARRLGDDLFSAVARLFVLGEPVPRDALGLQPDGFERLGLARVEGGELRPLVRLVPHGDYYLVSDLDHESAPDTASDFVPGIQAPSVTLAKLAVRRGVGAALDIGTGCGIQALLAAKHSERVVATDVNPRALNFAAFNLRLNGADNVELRLGDAFEPVERRRFGLIVANPPYVISPDASFFYRDSGLPRDEICRRMVQQVPAFLEEGGFAHLLISWVHEGDRWAEPLREWVRGNGCDVWLLHSGTQDPVSHAANWLRPLADTGPELYEEALDRWLNYFRSAEIEAIGYGAVVLRRRSYGSNWVREDTFPIDRLEPAGDHTLRVFAAQDLLGRLRDERELLDERFTLAESHRLEQTLTSSADGFVVQSQVLRLDEGFGFRVGVDRYTAALLPHFNGQAALVDVLARASVGVELGEDEREQFAAAALPVVRRLLELGFLSLAEP
jgi:Methyltransferase small domain